MTKKARREGREARRTLAALNGTLGAYRWRCVASGARSLRLYRTPEEAAKAARLHAAHCKVHVTVFGWAGVKVPWDGHFDAVPAALVTYTVPMRGPIKLKEKKQ